MNCPGVGTSVAPLKAGTLRALAVTSKNRHPDLPDVPTTAELGYPNMDHIQWNEISGPPKLPAFIVAKWEKAIEEISKDPEGLAKMKDIGLTPGYLDSKAIRDFVIKEIDDASKLWGILR